MRAGAAQPEVPGADSALAVTDAALSKSAAAAQAAAAAELTPTRLGLTRAESDLSSPGDSSCRR